MKLLITGAYQWTEEQKKAVGDLGYDISFQQMENDQTVNPEQFDGVVCNNLFLHNDITRFQNLKFIQLTSAGIKPELLEYTSNHSIALFPAKDIYSIPISELVLMQLLNIYKHSHRFFRNQTEHRWEKDRTISELCGKTALVVGYGSIGNEIVRRLRAFGVTVRIANRTQKDGISDEEYVPLSDLSQAASEADAVICSIALSPNTEHLISETVLGAMKENSVLINISRGQVIDQDALIRFLSEQKFLGVALDVTEPEPLPEESPLWDFENVYITPHNAFISDQVHGRMFDAIYTNLQKGITL